MESQRPRPGAIYRDLRSFLDLLEERGDLRQIDAKVDPVLEMTEVSRRVLAAQGPALVFSNPGSEKASVLTNLFGTQERVALAMGQDSTAALKEVGALLAALKSPQPPKGFGDALKQLPILKELINMAPKSVSRAPVQQCVLEGSEIDLSDWPIQTCWPGDAGPLISFGLTTTRGPEDDRQNVGIYRHQVIGRNRIIMRWLAHRGGALDYQRFRAKHPDAPFQVAISLGADPATLLAAVTPIPETLSEYAFAGLLRGKRTTLTKALGSDLQVPARAEMTLEGQILPGDEALEGPFGDHTGYYNEQERFPVMTVDRITHRQDPIYHSTYTGRPPDEPAILGLALNEVFVPLLRAQFPEIKDFYLPAEACSYRLAVISIKKEYPGHAKRVMFGIWSFLRQFMYTKFVIVTDDDIDIRSWPDVIWALSTRMDPARDTTTLTHTPIDYLDFASPVAGLGGKIGFDATNKWPGETDRVWGEPIVMDENVVKRVDELWSSLGLASPR